MSLSIQIERAPSPKPSLAKLRLYKYVDDIDLREISTSEHCRHAIMR